MSEMMRNFALLLWLACAAEYGTPAANAQGIVEENANINSAAPTIIVGEAARPDGTENAVIVEQPAGGGNPLGNPLPEIMVPAENTKQAPEVVKIPQKPVAAQKPQNKGLGKDFQNTLMESNGMVYDVQAYPKADLGAIGNPANPETIYSPNVNP